MRGGESCDCWVLAPLVGMYSCGGKGCASVEWLWLFMWVLVGGGACVWNEVRYYDLLVIC